MPHLSLPNSVFRHYDFPHLSKSEISKESLYLPLGQPLNCFNFLLSLIYIFFSAAFTKAGPSQRMAVASELDSLAP